MANAAASSASRRPGDLRRTAGRSDTSGRRGDLRGEPMKRAALFAGLVVLAWTAWIPERTRAPGPRHPVDPRLPAPLRPARSQLLPSALAGALKTVEIALLGTAVAAALALPLGFLSAHNMAPAPLFQPARVVLNFFRSIDTLVYALVFVAAVGLGPSRRPRRDRLHDDVAGQALSEAIEGIEPGPVDAVVATGATRLQVLRSAWCPRCCRSSSPTSSTASRPTSAPPPSSASSAPRHRLHLQTCLRMIDSAPPPPPSWSRSPWS